MAAALLGDRISTGGGSASWVWTGGPDARRIGPASAGLIRPPSMDTMPLHCAGGNSLAKRRSCPSGLTPPARFGEPAPRRTGVTPSSVEMPALISSLPLALCGRSFGRRLRSKPRTQAAASPAHSARRRIHFKPGAASRRYSSEQLLAAWRNRPSRTHGPPPRRAQEDAGAWFILVAPVYVEGPFEWRRSTLTAAGVEAATAPPPAPNCVRVSRERRRHRVVLGIRSTPRRAKTRSRSVPSSLPADSRRSAS
jgi:hypothetical protein